MCTDRVQGRAGRAAVQRRDADDLGGGGEQADDVVGVVAAALLLAHEEEGVRGAVDAPAAGPRSTRWTSGSPSISTRFFGYLWPATSNRPLSPAISTTSLMPPPSRTAPRPRSGAGSASSVTSSGPPTTSTCAPAACGRPDAVLVVLDDDRLVRLGAERVHGLHVHLRVGLAAGDVLVGHDHVEVLRAGRSAPSSPRSCAGRSWRRRPGGSRRPAGARARTGAGRPACSDVATSSSVYCCLSEFRNACSSSGRPCSTVSICSLRLVGSPS